MVSATEGVSVICRKIWWNLRQIKLLAANQAFGSKWKKIIKSYFRKTVLIFGDKRIHKKMVGGKSVFAGNAGFIISGSNLAANHWHILWCNWRPWIDAVTLLVQLKLLKWHRDHRSVIVTAAETIEATQSMQLKSSKRHNQCNFNHWTDTITSAEPVKRCG